LSFLLFKIFNIKFNEILYFLNFLNFLKKEGVANGKKGFSWKKKSPNCHIMRGKKLLEQRGNFKKILLCCPTSSQIWLINVLNGH